MDIANQAWYQKCIETIFEELETSVQGLSSSEAHSRLEKFGQNQLPEKRSETIWMLLFRQIQNPLIYVLIGSSILAIVMGKITDGFVVFGVVIINALIGFFQEYRSSKEIAALKNMVPDTVAVIRDGHPQTVQSSQLVPGDIVLLQSGDKIPADIRLFEMRSLRVIEAALTGESVPSEKAADTIPEETSLGDRKNIAFSGTTVASGTARGVVVQTGTTTELGKINTMLIETQNPETPLTRSIAHIAKTLTFVILLVGAALFGIALLRGYPIADAILASITLAVAAIPEGIPAIITIALAIGVRRMANRKAVIRHLPAVETLGSTTVICSDKTGTITKNEMTVRNVWTLKNAGSLTGTGYDPSGTLLIHEFQCTDLPADLRELFTAGVLCNDAYLRNKNGQWIIEGDPTEGALLTSAQKVGFVSEQIRIKNPRTGAIPFESDHKFMATCHRKGSGKIIYLKGAPEIVIGRCKLDPGSEDAVHQAVRHFAQDGKRVLAFAKKEVSDTKSEISFDDVQADLSFIGLQAMIDPPREEVRTAIGICHDAGITVKMITGDHQATAAAIGSDLKIISPQGSLSGEKLEHMDDSELSEAAATVNIFARVAPEHKLKLVSALQKNSEVVAMTGDGVNDAPALKRADIGVAMGITGTDVSKDAADIILTDDNFATIVSAVEEGRRVYDNLIKSLAFALPTNFGEALILLVAVAFFPITGGVPLLPMSPVQILWINLVATVTLALPLAVEAKEIDIMNRKPRRPGEPLLNKFVLLRTVFVALIIAATGLGLFLNVFNRETGAGADHNVAMIKAQTMAVTSIIFLQIFYLLNCRSLQRSIFSVGVFSNKSVLLGIMILILLQVGFVYLPFMNALFGSLPLDLNSWLESILFGAVVLPIITIEKAIRNHKKNHYQSKKIASK
ncbi:MAG TPA: HAD-IC family P-type ATPase [Chitinispirillaceae bacterium]|nr:HAD-IC family P-type ATPase [Chitinispirillaceae bacterium]